MFNEPFFVASQKIIFYKYSIINFYYIEWKEIRTIQLSTTKIFWKYNSCTLPQSTSTWWITLYWITLHIVGLLP